MMFSKGYLVIVSYTECTHTIKVAQCIGYVGTLQSRNYVLQIALFQFTLWIGLASATLYLTITLRKVNDTTPLDTTVLQELLGHNFYYTPGISLSVGDRIILSTHYYALHLVWAWPE